MDTAGTYDDKVQKSLTCSLAHSLACSEENQRRIQFCLCVSSTSLGRKTPCEFGLSLSYLVELSKCVAYLEMSTM